MRKTNVLLAVTFLLAIPSSRASAALIDIVLNFDMTVSMSQQAVFNQAALTIEGILYEYLDTNVPNGTQVVIDASIPYLDGVGNILGSAGPDFIFSYGTFWYTDTGSMVFDSADVANLETAGTFDDVILHEMFHVMGFGTLWTYNNLYVNGTGQYTGANALAQWQTEFGQVGATFVPVELGGGAGTANGHWNEVNGGGSNTGITDPLGRDMRYELMTGWLNSGGPGPFISNMTRASFIDLGYNAQLNSAPEPHSLALILIAGTVVGGVRRRKRRPADCQTSTPTTAV